MLKIIKTLKRDNIVNFITLIKAYRHSTVSTA